MTENERLNDEKKRDNQELDGRTLVAGHNMFTSFALKMRIREGSKFDPMDPKNYKKTEI